MSSSEAPFNAGHPASQANSGTAPGARLSPAAAAPAADGRWITSHPTVLSPPAAAGDSRAPAQIGSRLLAVSAGASAVLTVCVLLGGVASLVLFCFDPRQYHFYPVCFFHKTTGLLCPGCGALRALHQLLHGHLATALRFNPVLIVSLPFLCWIGGRFALQEARNQPLSLGLRPSWLWLMLAVVLVVSVLRNLPGAPFTMLRP